MPGMADYGAEAALGWILGVSPITQVAAGVAPGNRFLACLSAAPTSDAGTGGTECSAGNYARVQFAGTQTAASSGGPFSGTTITLSAAASAWLLALGANNGAGCNVFDVTTGKQIGTTLSVSTATPGVITLTGTATNAVANSDVLQISAFPYPSASTGTEPAVVPVSAASGAVISYAANGATGWTGNPLYWQIYDALSLGNCLFGDYFGAYAWLPWTATAVGSGNGPVLTAHAHGYANNDPLVITFKYGGTAPTFTQSNFTNASNTLIAANQTTDTFTLTNAGTAPWTTTTSDGMVRKMVVYTVGVSTTFSIAAGQLTAYAA